VVSGILGASIRLFVHYRFIVETTIITEQQQQQSEQHLHGRGGSQIEVQTG